MTGANHLVIRRSSPVSNIVLAAPIASAAAVLFGRYGAVSHLAQERGICRQAIYREADQVVEAVQGTENVQVQQQLQQRIAELEERLTAVQSQLRQAVLLGAEQVAEFASTGQALGVPLSAARVLLGVLTPQPPSVAQLGRLAQAAGRRAGALLAVLDEHSRAKARQIAADEIFVGRKPVLMTVEQESLCWLGGRLAASRDGQEWAQDFRLLPAAEQVTRDGGQGLAKGLALVNAQRQHHGRPPIADQEDHFHLVHRGQRALTKVRQQAARALDTASKAQKPIDRARRGGVPLHGSEVRAAQRRWQQAEAAYDRWVAQEGAWQRLRAALRLFTPQGQLNTRARAEAEVHTALAELTGPEWQRVRTKLAGPETFTFLDRVHEQLAALPVAADYVRAAVPAEGLRRHPALLRGEDPSAAALRGVLLAAGLVLSLAGEASEQTARLVRGVLGSTWRASSLVEGLNSVLRMQQARQKRLTPGLLDLKRFYWNLHEFRAGRRKGQTPYGRLGVVLPPGRWWLLLKIPPEQLRQQLSALNAVA
jgi:hypothetical protein